VKRVLLQILLGIGGLLIFFRFGGPALVFGATGPGPFGNRWLAQGNSATLLLDFDVRFFSAMRSESALFSSGRFRGWKPWLR
jgi:hypothetical protein